MIGQARLLSTLGQTTYSELDPYGRCFPFLAIIRNLKFWRWPSASSSRIVRRPLLWPPLLPSPHLLDDGQWLDRKIGNGQNQSSSHNRQNNTEYR